MAVITDIIQGNSASRTIRGWEFNRIYIVSELSGDGDAMLVEAVTTTGVSLGDSHPEIATAFVREFIPESIAGNQVRVTIIYRQFDTNYRYDIDSGTRSIESIKYFTDPATSDTLGDMLVAYTFPNDYQHDTEWQGDTDIQAVNAVSEEPSPILRITRTELLTTSADTLSGHSSGIQLTGTILLDRNLQYASRTNKSGWNLRSGDAAGLWLCHGIRGISQDNGLSWQVAYSFEYRSGGWKFEGKYIDPRTGVPPADLVDDVGIAFFDLYQQQNFNLLGLT